MAKLVHWCLCSHGLHVLLYLPLPEATADELRTLRSSTFRRALKIANNGDNSRNDVFGVVYNL